MKVVAVRPPGMKRATTISMPPRSSSVFCAHFSRFCAFSLEKNRRSTLAPRKWPIAKEMLSPTIAPAAAHGITSSTASPPEAAMFPATIAVASLGTIGKNASSMAIAKTIK